MIREERAVAVRKAIASLPKKQRATLILRTYHDMSHQQIADMLGSSVGAVKANFFHALAQFEEDPGNGTMTPPHARRTHRRRRRHADAPTRQAHLARATSAGASWPSLSIVLSDAKQVERARTVAALLAALLGARARRDRSRRRRRRQLAGVAALAGARAARRSGARHRSALMVAVPKPDPADFRWHVAGTRGDLEARRGT